MSRRANCWDNAVAESFFSTLKGEWLDHHRFLRATVLIVDHLDSC